ncbi:MAG: membrane dipeptidase, partial [bacterium]
MKISRLEFLRSTSLFSLGMFSNACLGGVLGSAATHESRAASLNHKRRVFADLHAHPLLDDWIERSPLAVKFPAIAKLVANLINTTGVEFESAYKAGIDLICVAHFNLFDEWLSMPTDPNPEAPANTLRMMDLLEAEIAGKVRPYAKMVCNGKQLSEALSHRHGQSKFRTAVIHTLEGGHALGGDLRALNEFARRGVASITVTHFFNKGIGSAANSFPFFRDSGSRWPYQGLSEFGEEVIKKMETLGIIVDIAHATAATVNNVLRICKKPLAATHVSARTLGDRAYSLYDEHIQQISNDGGIIGIILMPYWLSNY